MPILLILNSLFYATLLIGIKYRRKNNKLFFITQSLPTGEKNKGLTLVRYCPKVVCFLCKKKVFSSDAFGKMSFFIYVCA